MNLDSVITIISLIVAVYAVIPRVRQLEISLRFDLFAWLVVFCFVFVVLYLQFYPTFQTLGLTPTLGLARWGMTTHNVSFLGMLILALFLYVYISLRGLPNSKLDRFRELLFELKREKRFSELFSLFETYLSNLNKLYIGNKFNKLRSDLINKNSTLSDNIYVLDEQNKIKVEKSKKLAAVNKMKRTIFNALIAMLPKNDNEIETIDEIAIGVILDESVINELSRSRPYLAINLTDVSFIDESFFDIYLRCLVKNESSVLYHEVKNNQNLAEGGQYANQKANKVLSFLFTDSNVAYKLGVYKPVGESTLTYLENLHFSKCSDPYNLPMGEFREEGQWGSQLFLGINFFDILVRSALVQNVTWHMWLFYYSYFIEKIIRNMPAPIKLENYPLEWASRYHFSLYLIISNLCSWIKMINRLPANQENIHFESLQATHENGNIIKSSMVCLGEICRSILVSDKLNSKYKDYLMDMVYRCCFDLEKNDKTRNCAVAMRNILLAGGHEI